MKCITHTIAACLLLLCSQLALADGKQLLTQCEAAVAAMDQPTQPYDHGGMMFCLGTVSGVIGTLHTYREVLDKPERDVCLPEEGITNGKAVRLVVWYLHHHPELLQQSASEVVLRTLLNVYPCW